MNKLINKLYYSTPVLIWMVFGFIIISLSLLIEKGLPMQKIIIYSLFLCLILLFFIDYFFNKREKKYSSSTFKICMFLLFILLALYNNKHLILNY